MTSKKLLVSFAAILALAVFMIANVSAITSSFGSITDLEVNGVDMLGAITPVAVFAGEKVPVRVTFEALDNAEDVRVKVWIAGERELASISERFDVIDNNTYSRTVLVEVPSNLDKLDEALELNVVIENRNDGIGDEASVPLTLERESYVVEVLDANMANEVSTGDVLFVDVVLKNRGRYFAEDTFVQVSIPALGIQNRAFFGDLSSVDQPFSDNPFEIKNTDNEDRLNKEDTAERRIFLNIPSNAPAGLYVVEVKAYNSDSETTVTRKVVITGSETSSNVLAPVHSKTFGVGETAGYDLVLVNSGNKLQVFELVIEASNGLTVDVSEPIVAIPAGTSKTVKFEVSAEKEGTYNFAVNIHSGTELVKRESFTANAEGSKSDIVTGSPAVLLTVVLAVVFVVLLIVLIVLLTRRPEKAEETGESYY